MLMLDLLGALLPSTGPMSDRIQLQKPLWHISAGKTWWLSPGFGSLKPAGQPGVLWPEQRLRVLIPAEFSRPVAGCCTTSSLIIRNGMQSFSFFYGTLEGISDTHLNICQALADIRCMIEQMNKYSMSAGTHINTSNTGKPWEVQSMESS